MMNKVNSREAKHVDETLEKKEEDQFEVTGFVEADEDIKATTKADYSGFTRKTDPKEIKLVRKLDRYIMLSLWSMYWLNYLDRNAIALARSRFGTMTG
jgi:hypothetical protein